jgi:hypothetical protein
MYSIVVRIVGLTWKEQFKVLHGDLSSSSFSIWWLTGDCQVAAFVMNRPDEERQIAPEWIKSK